MDGSVAWFVFGGVAAWAGWAAGTKLGAMSERAARITGLLSIALLFAWAWLVRNPQVTTILFPGWLLSRVEGFAGVPMYMAVCGAAWARSRKPPHRMAFGMAAMLGVIYLLQGGMWMLQPSPAATLASTSDQTHVLQTQDWSCVPAACATALNELGVRSSEAEMAKLTHTRPGTGSTFVRALHGMQERLVGTGIQAIALQISTNQLNSLPMPLVTPLQFEPTRQHMVTLLEVTPLSVRIHDPSVGRMVLPHAEFDQVYTGHVIAFTDDPQAKLAWR